MKNKYLLAIPAYNCAPQINRLLNKLTVQLEDQLGEIIIINNRSTDGTEQAVLDFIKSGNHPKVKLFRNDDNYSLGGSHKVAFLYGKKMAATHVIILHGDDQAEITEIPLLIEKVESNNNHTVLGSRFNKDSVLIGYDKKRIFGNKVLNVVFSLLSGHHVEDLGSGLNILAMEDLDEERYLNFANKLTFNFELLIDLLDRKVSFKYYPITWREEDQVSNARNFNIAFTGIKNILSWRFNKRNFFKSGEKEENYTSKEVRK